MNACMIAHATQEEEDAARREWFGKADERVREKEHAEEQKKKHEEFKDKWWAQYRDEKRQTRDKSRADGEDSGKG
jgi:COX assembly mitochondrial protein 1